MTENNLVLTDSQKLDELMRTVGALKENFETLCNATQDLVDKLALPNTPTRPTSNQSAKTDAKPSGTTASTQTQQQTTSTTIKVRTIEDIKNSFPKEVADKLDFSLRDAGTKAYIKPVAFLGSEIFGNVNRAINAMGGMYVSAGKDSHFEVSLKRSA